MKPEMNCSKTIRQQVLKNYVNDPGCAITRGFLNKFEIVIYIKINTTVLKCYYFADADFEWL